MNNRQLHEWDEDACCIWCGLDGADAWHQRNILRLEIGADEYAYRRSTGEFDADDYCAKRPAPGEQLTTGSGSEA